jgi:membrane-anchored protein YejM (alkaline phosphatase superfamily)
MNVAIGGWYIPYCRFFAQDAFRCYWDQMYKQSAEAAPSFADAVRFQNRSLFETSMFSLFGQSVTAERHAAEYRSILDFALAEEADPDAGLIYIHFNIPHAPYFYDAKSGRFDAPGRGLAAYADALMLVDRTVEQLEGRLDSKTVLILSADHPLRVADQVDGVTDQHVPFIVHWPGQTKGLREDEEFSSLRTAPLILEILEGRVRTPEDAAQVLKSR